MANKNNTGKSKSKAPAISRDMRKTNASKQKTPVNVKKKNVTNPDQSVGKSRTNKVQVQTPDSSKVLKCKSRSVQPRVESPFIDYLGNVYEMYTQESIVNICFADSETGIGLFVDKDIPSKILLGFALEIMEPERSIDSYYDYESILNTYVERTIAANIDEGQSYDEQGTIVKCNDNMTRITSSVDPKWIKVVEYDFGSMFQAGLYPFFERCQVSDTLTTRGQQICSIKTCNPVTLQPETIATTRSKMSTYSDLGDVIQNVFVAKMTFTYLRVVPTFESPKLYLRDKNSLINQAVMLDMTLSSWRSNQQGEEEHENRAIISTLFAVLQAVQLVSGIVSTVKNTIGTISGRQLEHAEVTGETRIATQKKNQPRSRPRLPQPPPSLLEATRFQKIMMLPPNVGESIEKKRNDECEDKSVRRKLVDVPETSTI